MISLHLMPNYAMHYGLIPEATVYKYICWQTPTHKETRKRQGMEWHLRQIRREVYFILKQLYISCNINTILRIIRLDHQNIQVYTSHHIQVSITFYIIDGQKFFH